MRHQSGFTLIEIVIVLMIVGLLLFGTLRGVTMVHHAKVRKTVQMVEDIRTASNLFYREQGRLPGDGGVGGAVGGTVLNGLIVGAIEKDAFKEELIKNGYLKGAKDAGGKWLWNHSLNGVIYVEAAAGTTINSIVLTNITVDDKLYFDGQYDGDGIDGAGPVQYTGSGTKILNIYL